MCPQSQCHLGPVTSPTVICDVPPKPPDTPGSEIIGAEHPTLHKDLGGQPLGFPYSQGVLLLQICCGWPSPHQALPSAWLQVLQSLEQDQGCGFLAL